MNLYNILIFARNSYTLLKRCNHRSHNAKSAIKVSITISRKGDRFTPEKCICMDGFQGVSLVEGHLIRQ